MKELEQLCQKYQVERLYVFGSVTDNTFDSNSSDIDFLVSFQTGLSPLQMGANMLAIMEELEALFSRKVDLLRERPSANPYFAKALNESKTLVYDWLPPLPHRGETLVDRCL